MNDNINEIITIGTVFTMRGKHPKQCKVTDIHKTYNAAEWLIKTTYVATHMFGDQVVTEYDIPAATIVKGFNR